MKEITVQELAALKKNEENFQLIDVRESYEFDACNLGGESIPLGDVPHRVGQIEREKKVILYCKSGTRSLQVAKWLVQNHDFENLYSLKGGISTWAKEIDASIDEAYL